MVTDVTLRSKQKTVVIECKYTASLIDPGRFHSPKLRSSHLYQLCTYLRALEANGGADRSADGVLLYPSAGLDFDESFLLHGHTVRVKTLDLNRHWMQIENQLVSLLPAAAADDENKSC